MADWIAPFRAGAWTRGKTLSTGDVRALLALGWWGVLIEYRDHISAEDAEIVRGYLMHGEAVDVWIGQVTDREALRVASFDMGRAAPGALPLCGLMLAKPQPLLCVKDAPRTLPGLMWAPWRLRRVSAPLVQASGLFYDDARTMGDTTYYILA